MKVNMLKLTLLGVLFVLAGFIVYKEYHRKDRPAPGVQLSLKAAQFSLPDVNGKVINLSDFQGKVVFINFWATWCAPCREEIPSFVELYQQYKDKGFEIVGISLDDGGIKDVKPFIQKYNINYKVVIGNEKVSESYGGIFGIPTTFVLDRNGVIHKKYIGPSTKEDFEAQIKALL